MDGQTSGFVGVLVNGRGSVTIDAVDYPTGLWHFSQMPWTPLAGETSAEIRIEWLGPAARVDTVTFAPVGAYCGGGGSQSSVPLGIMPDGEFECGLGAWTQQVPDGGCVAGVVDITSLAPIGGVSPQGFGRSAWRAFEAGAPDPAKQELGVSARLVSPRVAVTPGRTYMLAFATYFDRYGVGFVGVMVNDVPVYTRDPGDAHQGLGWFAPNQVFWTAPEGVTTARVRIEAVVGAAGTMMVDGVVFVEATGES
ncbi:hypothetical protein B0T17DRAFT_531607 [Bombardia bombarda]|uniref:Uncharacterized protein n=1 Tax=Bombardia bombarda TaxID=252184 RepID=A0AA40C5G3_9PEZI|nr:hypothetical protein B0T17DRAFT_531607 [Bombardia bombarda]